MKAGEQLIENSAVGEMVFCHLVPATERLLDPDQPDRGKLRLVPRADDPIVLADPQPRPAPVPKIPRATV
jgi:hypothetical protein